MGTESRAVPETAVRLHATLDQPGGDHRFFTIMAALCALLVFVGFAPSYYLRSLTERPPLSPLLHLHGAVFTAWIVLFLAQASLVRAGRTDLHRRLGIAGLVLAAVLVVIGWMTAIDSARRGFAPPGAPSQPGFLLVPLSAVLSFAALAGVGTWNRRRPETHKRLMLLATIALLPPALARVHYDAVGGRVHPALLWGSVFLTVSLVARFALAWTDGWRAIGAWLIR